MNARGVREQWSYSAQAVTNLPLTAGVSSSAEKSQRGSGRKSNRTISARSVAEHVSRLPFDGGLEAQHSVPSIQAPPEPRGCPRTAGQDISRIDRYRPKTGRFELPVKSALGNS